MAYILRTELPTSQPNKGMEQITVYGTDTCEDTRRAREQLDALHVSYRYANIEHDPKAKAYADLLGDTSKTPVIAFGSGGTLVEPSNAEIVEELTRRQILPSGLGYIA